ncbi:Polycystic kidney disease protein 1-like 3 [Cytospora mali]|uniref:Polycystic kidney disease protein 1-like 3 n=1 Tax=Cytospora mali TaxID=578113 RepID=A0A194VX05_CYTMA|nr:Polycystic kidney disease protein 1-like 3 [Valsa mali]
MDSSALNNAAYSAANAATAAASDNALPKNPSAEGQDNKPADLTTMGVAEPLQVAPETNKPVDTPAATTNGTAAAPAGVNGTENKFEPVVPEEHKQTDDSSAAPDTQKPASSIDAPVTTESSGSGQPPVMTGANPSTSEPKQTGLDHDDGVKEAAAGAAPVAAEKPTDVNGSKDIDMKDAPLEAPASDSAPTASQAVPTTSDEPTSKTAGTGEKRKADTDATNGASAAEEPAEKKQKSTVEKVVDKAKEVVEDVKEKTGVANNRDNGPARKASKRGKKEAPPVGRTERKTRSQGRVE